MLPRYLVFITMLVLCHPLVWGQALTNAAPPSAQSGVLAADQPVQSGFSAAPSTSLPDDPGQEILPVAQPEPMPAAGVPVEWEAQDQSRVGDTWTLTGEVVVHYRDYILRADKIIYHQSTTELEAEGNLQLIGGPHDVRIYATRGDMRLNMHTARFYNVHGSQGIRTFGRTAVYSTTNPLLFSGRVLLKTGEGHYRIIDGTMTNCHLPRPDWQIISRSIKLDDGTASTSSAYFKLFGVPILYLPYLRHPVEETGRESGFLIPVFGMGSSIRGYTFGEQAYWVISRNMDMTAGTEYFSKRGWSPNGDFRYKGPGRDHLAVRWNAMLDRGFIPKPTDPTPSNCLPHATSSGRVNQGGVDIKAEGRKDLTAETRLAGNIEFLSCYVYRLVFSDNYSQAVSSEVQSNVSLTHAHRGFVPSISMGRFETFASTAHGDETKILHLPSLRLDVLDRPLADSWLSWGLGSSLGYLSRSEPGYQSGPGFHARNAVRVDFHPHFSLPLSVGGWSVLTEAAVRETAYSISQTPDLTGANGGIPTISHDPLNRTDVEASVQLRPPALAREFALPRWNRKLRHVIEPELTYRYVTGIGTEAQRALLIDTTDIATNTNEVGFSLTQRFYLRSTTSEPCAGQASSAPASCPAKPREWASWQIAQKLYIDSSLGGALISGRRNVFDSTLDLSAVAFLTSPRNLAPVISRLRFEAIDNLRIQWDLDYDPKAGRMGADNLFAGYSWGQTTIGLTHALLNAVEENGSTASTIKSQLLQPFFTFGNASDRGFNLAANGGYDFVHGALQYAGVQAVYNLDCCGISFGYRRFALGSVRNETQWLYGFTLANFGSVGNIRRANTAFPDPSLPPTY
jgi:LPS-assembly protein